MTSLLSRDQIEWAKHMCLSKNSLFALKAMVLISDAILFITSENNSHLIFLCVANAGSENSCNLGILAEEKWKLEVVLVTLGQ